MMTDSVSDATRNRVWGMLCDLERSSRYYRTLGDRYRLRYRGLRYFLLLLVVVECSIFGFSLSQPMLALVVGGLVALLLAGLTVIDSVTGWAEAAAELRVASMVCDDLSAVCERLWLDIETYRIVDGEGRQCLEDLDSQWSRACQRVSLELHDHDNRKAAVSGYTVVANRYRVYD